MGNFGDTAIITANGPSLKEVPIDFLVKYPSFGTNAIYLRDDFYPSFYVAFDKGFIQREKTDVQTFVDIVPAAFIRQGQGITGKNVIPIYRIDLENPESPNSLGVQPGGTVTYMTLQIAMRLKFKNLLIVGLDFNYFDANKSIPHFDDKYPTASNRNKNQARWNERRITTELNYLKFRKQFGAIGGEIINLTPNSKCESFRRGDIKDYD